MTHRWGATAVCVFFVAVVGMLAQQGVPVPFKDQQRPPEGFIFAGSDIAIQVSTPGDLELLSALGQRGIPLRGRLIVRINGNWVAVDPGMPPGWRPVSGDSPSQ